MPRVNDIFRGPPRLNRRWRAEIDDHVISTHFAPNGKTLAVASVSGPITLYEVASGKALHTLAGHGFGTTSVAWHRDCAVLASAGQDGKIRLWDTTTGTPQAEMVGGAAWMEHVTWQPNGDTVIGAGGKKLRQWTSTGELLREFPDHPATISDLAWRPGTDELTSASYGGVFVWRLQAMEPTYHLEWKGSVLKLAWSPDGKHLAHGNQDATIHYWELATTHELQMAGYPIKVRELSWDPTGKYLATGGGEVVTVWDCSGAGPEGRTPLSFEGHEGPISALTYQARGPLLASGGLDGKVYLWQPGKYKKSIAQSASNSPVSQMEWSQDDRLLAVGTETGGVVVYSVG